MSIKDALIILTGIMSAIYLFNPSAGIFEIIPDSFLFIGNLDEPAT